MPEQPGNRLCGALGGSAYSRTTPNPALKRTGLRQPLSFVLAHPIENHMSDKINEFILSLESDKSILVSKLRDLASGLSNTSKEDIKWNALCFFKGERAFVGIMPYKNYVSVIFDKGSQLSDPNKILEGKGKQMRHIKIYQEQDIKDKNVESFIKESYQLD